ncbi:DNA translocase ftsK [Salmonella enterica subsp. enterica]|uniref:DNA translocase ftsK n=1 Tax=Salmonella enterica I TaxID=59201 RepID=A0A447PGJ3_SALET|nr:DNA translocase ftsK [Salmonella enterica subsp. enterica]
MDGITSDSESEGGGGGFDGGEELDALFDQAVNFVTQKRKASISGVQRQFRIGYNRAARIIEQMEAQGIVSAQGITVIVKCWLRRLLSKPVSRMALCRLPSRQQNSVFSSFLMLIFGLE